MKGRYCLTAMLLVALSSVHCPDKTAAAEDGIKLAELMDLPTTYYVVDPYLRAAQSLQGMGKEKACAKMRELAAKDRCPHTRTLVLCRMLFKAKKESDFRRAYIGGPGFVDGGKPSDWPLEPIVIIEGVPFRVARVYVLAGQAEPLSDYLDYCIQECDWNDIEFKPRSKKQKQEALEKLPSTPQLKGRVTDHVREVLAAQIE